MIIARSDFLEVMSFFKILAGILSASRHEPQVTEMTTPDSLEVVTKKFATLWDKESEEYAVREIGSGVEKFVKDLFASPIFNLKEGRLSTPHKNRKEEFIDKPGKAGRTADVVIFINEEIVIPVEIEKYRNITAGESQIYQYQLDWDKSYGILTDGFTWRFHNNNAFRTITLPEILKETNTFLAFWRDYIKPENYYLSFFEPQGQLSLLRETEDFPVELNRDIFFTDITRLIDSFSRKLKVGGYFENLTSKEQQKKAIEVTYAYLIQFILYKTLVDNDYGSYQEKFRNAGVPPVVG